MSTTEEKYAELIRAMTPAQRMQRAEALIRWSREFIVRSIRRERPEITDEELRWELAFRLYGSDPKFRAWAEEQRDRATR